MKLPKSWKEITIKQFVECQGILLDTNVDIIEREVMYLSTLSGETIDTIESLPLNKIKEYVKAMEFLKTLPEGKDWEKLPKYFRLKGRTFYFDYDITKIRGGQYVDFMSFMKQDTVSNMHNLLACVCVPSRFILFKGKYDGERHRETAQLFYERMTMDIAYPIVVFFCKVFQHLIPSIHSLVENQLTTLNLEMEKLIQEREMNLQNTGDGC
jgi:hypothetical protein